jgi:hypothetical protein
MKRWAILTVSLYGLVLLLLTLPAMLGFSLKWTWTGKESLHLEVPLAELFEIYSY